MTFNIRRDSSQFYILRCTHIKEKWVHTAPDYAIVQKTANDYYEEKSERYEQKKTKVCLVTEYDVILFFSPLSGYHIFRVTCHRKMHTMISIKLEAKTLKQTT